MTNISQRILCVDDDAYFLSMLRRQLGRTFDLTITASSQEALRIVQERGPFALVIADQRMPEMDGLEFLRRLRPMAADTVFVMLTVVSELDLVVSALRDAQIFRFLTKPCPSELLVGTVRDSLEHYRLVESEKLLKQELEAAHLKAVSALRVKSEFLDNISHEIRTPMTAILGNLERVVEGCLAECAYGKEDLRGHLNTASRNAGLLLQVVDDLLALSESKSARASLERTACHPCRIVADVASFVRAQAVNKGLAFDVEYVGSIPETITSDAARLRQILIRVLGNAIKFTEEGGIRLIARCVTPAEDVGGPYLQFDVVDTGHGMTSEQLSALFRPFVQGDASCTRTQGGVGVGLAICKQYAQLLGGDVVVVESGEALGTQFRVTVDAGSLEGVRMITDPASETVVTLKTGEKSLAEVPQAGLSRCSVLLVEDGPDNQRLIAHFLRVAGASVTIRENGRLAVETALAARDRGEAFDVILMDMQMPVMDGYEATAQLRGNDYAGPIIALTAHAAEGSRERCLRAGCDAYATKPIDRKKLVQVIQERVGVSPSP